MPIREIFSVFQKNLNHQQPHLLHLAIFAPDLAVVKLLLNSNACSSSIQLTVALRSRCLAATSLLLKQWVTDISYGSGGIRSHLEIATQAGDASLVFDILGLAPTGFQRWTSDIQDSLLISISTRNLEIAIVLIDAVLAIHNPTSYDFGAWIQLASLKESYEIKQVLEQVRDTIYPPSESGSGDFLVTGGWL